MFLAALSLAAGAGCQRWSLVMIDLRGIPDIDLIASLRARVYETQDSDAGAGGYVHDNVSDTNAEFRKRNSVGVYLPKGVRQFAVVIDALDILGCRILTGAGTFDVNAPAPTLNLVPPTDEICRFVTEKDSGSEDTRDDLLADLAPDVTDAPTDVSDADGSDSIGADHGECGADTTVVTCFDPSDVDAGAPDAFVETAPNPDCNTYCDDMIANCPGTFADRIGCIAVCTEAGWQLPADGSSEGTTLSCLANHARAAATEPMLSRAVDCAGGDPSEGECSQVCKPYCLLRQRFCQDPPSAEADCETTCNRSPSISLTCLMQIMEHDVPSDRRFCQWTQLDQTCGTCATP